MIGTKLLIQRRCDGHFLNKQQSVFSFNSTLFYVIQTQWWVACFLSPEPLSLMQRWNKEVTSKTIRKGILRGCQLAGMHSTSAIRRILINRDKIIIIFIIPIIMRIYP